MNVRKWGAKAPVGAALAVVLLGGCGFQGDGDAAGHGDSVVVGMSDEVLAVDPASGYDPGSWLLFNNVFQSLLSFPRGGSTPEPEAAKSCVFESGNTVYRCTLRDGLTFSNGNSLTSEDVKYSFERAIRINDPSGPAPLLTAIEKITAPDPQTVVFRLKAPDATFPSKIASGAGSIVDHSEYPADALRKDGKAVGSGPYELKSFDKSKAVFSVNSDYRGTARAKNSGITLDFFRGDQAGLVSALQKGKVDVAYRGLAAQDIEQLEESSAASHNGIHIVEGSSAEVHHLVFNLNHPVAGRLPVRKAIAYLVNRDALVSEVYHSTATPLYSIVPAGITAHNTAFFDTYGGSPQPAKAEQVLRGAGITGKVKLTLWSTPSRYGPATDNELGAIAQQLNESGLFDAKVESLPFEQYEKRIEAGELGVYVKGWVPDYPDPDNFTQPFFGKDNVLQNGYASGDIASRIIPGTAAQADRGTTQEAFGELQDKVAEELPILPLWQGKQYAVASDDVSGLEWTLDASTVFRFWEISKFS